jgi:hypothetical protein
MANFRERSFAVQAFNIGLEGRWLRADTDEAIPDRDWFFVAASLSDGAVGDGELRIFIDDRKYRFISQMVMAGPNVDLIGSNTSGAVIDELAVFQRAFARWG